METSPSIMTGNTVKKTVLSFLEALNKDDFSTARKYLNNDLLFVGVLGTRNGADTYMNDMEKMRLKYDIKKVLSEGNDVCILYDIIMQGISVFCCGWYQLENEKISSIRVVFDPRPVLEASGK